MWPWDWPQLLLTGIVMVINQKFFISGFTRACFTEHRTWIRWWLWEPGRSFGYSIYALFAMTVAQVEWATWTGVMSYMHEFYFRVGSHDSRR